MNDRSGRRASAAEPRRPDCGAPAGSLADWPRIATGGGPLDTLLVHPREVFKAALLANAAAIVVAHNHPSGDPTPSPDDMEMTRRLVAAGGVLGMSVLDHIIVGHGGYYSFHEGGLV